MIIHLFILSSAVQIYGFFIYPLSLKASIWMVILYWGSYPHCEKFEQLYLLPHTKQYLGYVNKCTDIYYYLYLQLQLHSVAWHFVVSCSRLTYSKKKKKKKKKKTQMKHNLSQFPRRLHQKQAQQRRQHRQKLINKNPVGKGLERMGVARRVLS